MVSRSITTAFWAIAALALTTAAALTPCAAARAQVLQAEWTIMVYMNAKNNLEPAGIDDFLEMAKIGSQPAVNVVAQLGRPTGHFDDRYERWSGVKRYRIEKGLLPQADKALVSIPDTSPEWDMGRIESLVGFLAWAQESYPAKKYMLIIWNHGHGWRLQLTATRNVQNKHGFVDARRIVGGFRSVSHDDDTGNVLYNRQIQDGLAEYLKGQKLDVIAFDACLMAMVETAYAMRGLAPIMVASEELEPGAGWQYDTWLAALSKAPQASGREVAIMAVESYRDRYRDRLKTTLSALDLGMVEPLAQSISDLAHALDRAGEAGTLRIRAARGDLESYGDQLTEPNYVDLGLVLDGVLNGGTADEIGKAAARASSELGQMVFANYRSARVTDGFGSNGLSIFFPESAATFKADPDGAGYSRSNAQWPVQFVQEHYWSCFLTRLLLGAGPETLGCQ